VRTERPKMTPGRAALLGIMQRYLPFTVEITVVDPEGHVLHAGGR
jgi:hypothetical protein